MTEEIRMEYFVCFTHPETFFVLWIPISVYTLSFTHVHFFGHDTFIPSVKAHSSTPWNKFIPLESHHSNSFQHRFPPTTQQLFHLLPPPFSIVFGVRVLRYGFSRGHNQLKSG
ncbi:hypothetical protein YC2023_066571 [Brassica napus]